MTSLHSTAVFALLVSIGWIGVLVEFVRPGWVIPGVAGGVALIVGFTRLWPGQAVLAMAVSAPFLLVAAWMISIGLRARRNKRTL